MDLYGAFLGPGHYKSRSAYKLEPWVVFRDAVGDAVANRNRDVIKSFIENTEDLEKELKNIKWYISIYPETIEFLIECGISFETIQQSFRPETTIMHQAVYESPQIVAWLLEKGVDPSIKDDRQRTPAYYAVQCNKMAVLNVLLRNESYREKAPQEYADWLECAVSNRNKQFTLKLLALCTDANITPTWHTLLSATRHHPYNWVKWLLDANVEIRQDQLLEWFDAAVKSKTTGPDAVRKVGAIILRDKTLDTRTHLKTWNDRAYNYRQQNQKWFDRAITGINRGVQIRANRHALMCMRRLYPLIDRHIRKYIMEFVMGIR